MARCFVFLAIVALAVIPAYCSPLAFGPLHASCKITWKFGISCKNVQTAIENQIAKWTSADNCKNGGEKCLYKLGTVSSETLTAKHETPVKHYMDSLAFNFKDAGSGCDVQGSSSSDTWYAVLDYGTNYCNLHNLITGSSLDKATGYSESTNDDICTQFSSADCEKY